MANLSILLPALILSGLTAPAFAQTRVIGGAAQPVRIQGNFNILPVNPAGLGSSLPGVRGVSLKPSLSGLPSAPKVQNPAVNAQVWAAPPILPANVLPVGQQNPDAPAPTAKQVLTQMSGAINPAADANPLDNKASFDKAFENAGGSGGAGLAAPEAGSQTPAQSLKLRTLKAVVSIFTEHYAPIEWKQSHRGVDFMAEYQKARAKILASPDMSQHEFQSILADFVASAQDYHAAIIFYSTEKSGLPIMILSAGGKHYIAYVDRGVLPESEFPYQPGDEIVEFGGRPVAQAAAEFTKFPNTAETDARLAEMRLTKRSRRAGVDVPQGPIAMSIRTADGQVHQTTLKWAYEPELIPTDIPTRGVVLGPETADPLAGFAADDLSFPKPPKSPRETVSDLGNGRDGPFQSPSKGAVRQFLRKFLPSMAHPQAGLFSSMAAAAPDNGFMIGGRKTYVPALGEVVWQLPPQLALHIPFVAKIFKDADGRRIGYLRIPDYMGGGDSEAAGRMFEKLVSVFQAQTDGLVIDQVNNPGGDMMLMNEMLSMLTDKPLVIPRHRLMLDESDAALAAQILQHAADPGVMEEMELVLQEMMAEFSGETSAMVQQLVDYANFILSELKAGRRLTNPTDIFGVKRIEPHAQTRYTKPIVVLINELDFSAADFFAAIMADNKRAALFGVRTAGAGGAVKDVQLPNQFGIETLAYTWTIAVRPGGDPIENLGVAPDVEYAITADDLRGAFAGYGKALGGLIARLVPPPAPGSTGTTGSPGAPKPPTPSPRKPRRDPRSR